MRKKSLPAIALAVCLTFLLTACGRDVPADGSAAASSGQSQSQSQASSGSSPSQSSKPPSGIPKEDLIFPMLERKEVDTDPKAMLAALREAYAEYDAESAADAQQIAMEDEPSNSENQKKTRYTFPNGVRCYVDVSTGEDSKTGETYQILSSAETFLPDTLREWPASVVYAAVRTFVCETQDEARMVTEALLAADPFDLELEKTLLPMSYGLWGLSIYNAHGRTFKDGTLAPFRIWGNDVSPYNTIVDGKRLPVPPVQQIDLNEVGYDYVLENREALYRAEVTATLVAQDVYDWGYAAYTLEGIGEHRGIRLQFANELEDFDKGVGLEVGDRIRITGDIFNISAAEYKDREGCNYSISIYVDGCELAP